MKNLFIAIVLIYFVLDGHSQADWLTYYQETVVAIGEIVKAEIKENDTVVVKDAFNLIGTGVCFYVKYDSIILPCLITAKHVFYNSRENWKPNTLMVRFSWFENTSILDYLGTELILEINREKHWFPHPDSTVDLAGIILFPD
ncbi:MAG: hypothetical protein JW731_07780, partial [Bacteroidales bacterium]|nr:hypothetical protein [Bacteroidales bacterium]